MTRSPKTPRAAESGADGGPRVPTSGRPGAGDEPDASDWERLRDVGRAGRAAGAGEPPPSADPPSLASLLAVLEAARALVPRELDRQFTALLREVLLTLRALIDWYLERLDGDEREQRVEDIPID